MASVGWGRDQWGLGPWGAAVPIAPLAIANARALSTREIEVTLDREPQTLAPTVAGDALNPATWTVQRLDNGFIFSVIAVAQTATEVVVLTLLQDLGSSRVQHRVLSTTLLDFDGNPISNPPLNRFDFAGVLDAEAKDALVRARRGSNAMRDIANPPLPARDPMTSIGGTFIINSGGDYELESGAPLLRKLIIRRLITPRGGFFHLPDYGIGLGVKDLLPAADLQKLRADIQREVLREPEVEEAGVRLRLGTQNDLTVDIRAKTRPSGESVEIGFRVTPGGVVL